MARELLLRELIARVRKELLDAESDRKKITDKEFFRVDSVTLEVNFVVSESYEGGGGIDLKVISASGKKTYAEEQVHKVSVSLTSPEGSWINPSNIHLYNAPDRTEGGLGSQSA